MSQTKPTPASRHDRTVLAEFPLSTTQQRCWYLDRINPGNPSLNVAVQWELRGPFSSTNLERAFQNVVDRHEILRTRFVQSGGDDDAVQQVLAAPEFRLSVVDLRTTPSEQRAARFDAIAQEDARQPFDLTEGGLIRATLVRFSPVHAMLLIVVHQSCFDGYSIRVLGHEVGTALAAYEAGHDPDLPDLPLQYGDFALWQQDYFASGILEEETAYWRDALADMSYFEIEPDKPRPASRGTNVRQLAQSLPADFGSRMETAAKRFGVSAYALGCAIVSASLHRMTDAKEVLFGTQIAGRNQVETEDLIGVFINNLVLRFPTAPDTTFEAHIQTARKVVEGALSHQNMPFNRLVEVLNPVRDAARTPLISVNFNLQQVFLQGRQYGAVEFVSAPSHAPGAIYDVNIVMIGRPTGWRINFEYATDLFETSTAKAMMQSIINGFEAALDGKLATIGDVPVDAALVSRGSEAAAARKRVEAALASHPAVGEAVAMAAEAGFYGFVVPATGCTIPLETLPRLLMDHAGATPGADLRLYGVSVMASLPRTADGGVNRRLLRAPAPSRRDSRPAPDSNRVNPDVTAKLAVWWRDILHLDAIPPQAGFFELGGHSLLVVRLLTRIREAWGIEIGIAAIYENATLDALSTLISARLADNSPAKASDWRIMRLKRDGSGTPLTAINNAATAMAVSGGFSAPRPTACLRLSDPEKGFDCGEMDFAEIATRYADIAEAAQPKGAFLLYGNCVHGNLAVEVARDLQTRGRDIAGVVMKDVWEPDFAESVLADPKRCRKGKWHDLRYRLKQARLGRMSWSAMLGSYGIIRRSGLLQLATRLGLIERVRHSDLEAHQEMFVAQLTAARNRHSPDPVDFPLLHIVTAITPKDIALEASIGWQAKARGRLKTVEIDEVQVHRELRLGTDDLASEIETFLAEGGRA